MVKNKSEEDVFLLTKLHDDKNIGIINSAYETGRIDKTTKDYLDRLYTNSMDLCRDVFLCIGKCFGAPKAPVMMYDYETDSAIDKPITIYSINPLSPYIVHHRLDADPMRNQFFTSSKGHKIDLSVSSIVTVIVGAQKSINRALDKITVKYYTEYVNEVKDVTYKIIAESANIASAQAITNKIDTFFSKGFYTDASENVLSIIGSNHQKIATRLVRNLDKIKTPYERLTDVWRVKCLFDLVPQARTFIEHVCEIWPDRVIQIKDKFFDITNPRGYRDAKIILNIGTIDNIIPMEIICQVRTFFEFEHQTHKTYETTRRKQSVKTEAVEKNLADFMEQGIQEYNLMIADCLSDLFDRIGWNILYSNGDNSLLFDGFPKISNVYYPNKIKDIIFTKVDTAVENEVFIMPNAPIPLTQDQKMRIFRWLAKFVLVTAMPYSNSSWSVNTEKMPGKFFNFIMKELQRYYKKS